jgi:hypothetical protein
MWCSNIQADNQLGEEGNRTAAAAATGVLVGVCQQRVVDTPVVERIYIHVMCIVDKYANTGQ